jgi:pyruvate dehydrogenase E1 component alpha subunit
MTVDEQLGAELDVDTALDLHRRMLRIRRFEERLRTLIQAGERIMAHLYVGEEAVAAGVCAALRDDDYITSTHRGHGHIIAKEGDLNRCMAELFGRKTGYCGGKGGSMHIADMSLGIIGANGIVGGGLPIATGAALSSKMRGSRQVSVCFFGDGASNQGSFHESLNLASVWSLPVVFVCENNGWAELTRTEAATSGGEVARRAGGYGIPGHRVDGNDVVAVFTTASAAVDRARSGGGPTLIEACTHRMFEHAEGLDRYATLRSEEEMEEWRGRDPIALHRDFLLHLGVAEAEVAALDARITADVDAAVEFSRSSPPPDPDSAFTDVFTVEV